MTDALSSAAEEIGAVADEYRDAAEAMGDAGGENEERADEIDELVQEIEGIYVDAPDENWLEATRSEFEGLSVP